MSVGSANVYLGWTDGELLWMLLGSLSLCGVYVMYPRGERLINLVM